jgi:hypothetical protein
MDLAKKKEAERDDRATLQSGEGTESVKRVFIVGFPRSGTTWVMWLLAQLPSVAAIQQSGIFHAFEKLENWWRKDHRFTRGEGGKEKLGMEGMASVLSYDDYVECVRPMISRIFQRVAEASLGTEIVVEQTPENMEYERTVRDVFPDALFIEVIRDPRDCYCSMRRAVRTWAGGFPQTPIHIANRWVEYIRRGRVLRAATENHVEVRYEDLSADPVAELKRIGRSLGLELDEATYQTAVEACQLDRMRNETGLPKGFFGKGAAGGWRDKLRGRELRLVEHIVGPEMERFGYEREHPRSRSKPLRLSFHEATARGFDTLRRGWRRVVRSPHQLVAKQVESIRYTQANGGGG